VASLTAALKESHVDEAVWFGCRRKQIFVNEDERSRAYPPERVLKHLQEFAPSLRIRYLEHIINHKDPSRQSQNANMHNILLAYYVEEVMNEIRQANGSLVEGTARCPYSRMCAAGNTNSSDDKSVWK